MKQGVVVEQTPCPPQTLWGLRRMPRTRISSLLLLGWKAKRHACRTMLVEARLRPAAKQVIEIPSGHRFGFYNLRHALTSRLVVEIGTDSKTIQDMLRWADPSILLKSMRTRGWTNAWRFKQRWSAVTQSYLLNAFVTKSVLDPSLTSLRRRGTAHYHSASVRRLRPPSRVDRLRSLAARW